MICRESALHLQDEYVKTKGHGVDLPFGCISDKTNVGLENHYVYWNPNGSAISKDPSIREICLEKEDEDPLKGMKIICLIWSYYQVIISTVFVLLEIFKIWIVQ